MTQTEQDLARTLHGIDNRGYKAYKRIHGRYHFPHFTLFIDHVQGDPYAAPSQLRVQVEQEVARYPRDLFCNDSRRVGLENYIAAAFDRACRDLSGRRGSGKSGLVRIDAPGQTMLDRTAVSINADLLEVRFVVGLPARGRRVLGRQAAELLCEELPEAVEEALLYENGRADRMRRYAETAEDADALRARLDERGLIAFVADDSILPRRSGVDDRPLTGDRVVPFRSPESMRVEFDLPNRGAVSGMGIPAGVTLIVGGGFHGKSTLLNALEQGIYNHRPGDGRELVVANSLTVKIRAEDGRRVAGVDISPFINNLPYGEDTTHFSSPNASGSTSQAANIMEMLALGAEVLLIDEDTAATNFMIRDRRMQSLIAKEKEPITPFIDKVRALYEEKGVSTVLVIGGSGDYFDAADQVIALDSYVPHDVTAEAKAIAEAHHLPREREGGPGFGPIRDRAPRPRSVDPSKGKRSVRIRVRSREQIQFGREDIDLGAISQLVDSSQTRAIAEAMVYAKRKYMDGKRPLAEVLHRVIEDVTQDGLDILTPYLGSDLAAFRVFELGAALNRLRTLQVTEIER